MNQIYRGYEIKKDEDQWDIYLNNKHICSQPSVDLAYKWIDIEKKKEAQGK